VDTQAGHFEISLIAIKNQQNNKQRRLFKQSDHGDPPTNHATIHISAHTWVIDFAPLAGLFTIQIHQPS
jgi:hypothetical protein